MSQELLMLFLAFVYGPAMLFIGMLTAENTAKARSAKTSDTDPRHT